MNVVLTGKGAADAMEEGAVVHKVLRPGYTLVVGSECNDGRPITESWRYQQAVKRGVPIVRKKLKKCFVEDSDTRTHRPLLVNKYAPRNLGEVIGHKEGIQQLRGWLGIWEKGYPEVRGALVTGPPGIGKTTTVHLVAQSLGYKVVEYNASDTRSISVLRGMIALGIRRLQKEVIVMDEVDGLSERGGTGELATILKKTCVPIICIANEKPPKLRPIVNACVDIPFRRPLKSTIAMGLEKIAKAEGLRVSRVELEGLCESSGNDIRSILNRLEFYEDKGAGTEGGKDSILRMDIFSATQSLFRGKRMSLDEAAGLVFVDYNMVPLMVQEGYLAACGDNLEAAAKAAEHLSFGDVLDRRIHTGQDWGLIPDFVQCSVAAARVAPGLAPFQLFPQWLGKNSKGLKHARYMRELGEKTGRRRGAEMRLEYVTPLQTILLSKLMGDKPDIKGLIAQLDEMGWTRDDVMENLQEVCLEAMEVPTKVKTAFTREYNKTHKEAKGASKKRGVSEISDDEGEEEQEEDDGMEEIQEGMEELEL
jgi:replication factor C subunit 1